MCLFCNTYFIFTYFIFHSKGQTLNDVVMLMNILNHPGERKLLNKRKLVFFFFSKAKSYLYSM